jgi:nucleoside-diphosphate-sugar epimerase
VKNHEENRNSQPLMHSLQELEDCLSAPDARDQDTICRIGGDILILGAGGKMGPSLARRINRAGKAVGARLRVIAVSRFSSRGLAEELQCEGIETIACDLSNRDAVMKLPLCANVLFLAGRKFGSCARPDLTWMTNTVLPSYVAERYRSSRIVVFSTGNVYPLVDPNSGGSVESDPPEPKGEYAQSCLGRERVFEHYSRECGTTCLLFRLNYAVELRYGIPVDIAQKVFAGKPVDLTVPFFNAIWQGDANSYALRCLELCSSPPRVLNVTGAAINSVRHTAERFGRSFNRSPVFYGEEGDLALLSNASLCHSLLGPPQVPMERMTDWIAHWVEKDGVSFNKPTRFEVTDGQF